jgi:hypothetical protein
LLYYPDEAVVEEEAERAGPDGEALLEALRDDGAHRGLRARARAAVVVLPQLGTRRTDDAAHQHQHQDDGDRRAAQQQDAAGCRH